jgi:hypothetical protein
VADLLPEVAASLTDREDVASWTRLRDEYIAVETLHNICASLREWFVSVLPSSLHELMHGLICLVLHALRSTGIDPTGQYCTLLWLHDGKVERGFKIPVSGSTRWVSLLKDTENSATFAYITNTCLVSGGMDCRGPNPQWPDSIHFLDTTVFIDAAEESVRLLHGRIYYFTLDNQTLWFEARGVTGAEEAADELVCLSFALSFPLKIVARVPLFGKRYGRARMLGENHLSGGVAERVKIRSII